MRYIREYSSSYEGIDRIYDNFRKRTAKNIIEICKKYDIKNYRINSDNSIDVDSGNIELYNKELTKLPLKFRNVNGSFACNRNKLTSLEYSPENIGDNFYCSYNNLTSLKGAPKHIKGAFYCRHNQIRDIYDMPEVDYAIFMDNNPVYSIMKYFIPNRKDKQEWIDLFNELDIIQDGYNVILDRLKYFYEGTKLNIDVTEKMLYEIRKEGYNII